MKPEHDPHLHQLILLLASGKIDSGFYAGGENPVYFYSKDMAVENKALRALIKEFGHPELKKGLVELNQKEDV